MEMKGMRIITVLILVSLIFSACNVPQAAPATAEPSIPPEPTADIQATIYAGIAATDTAQAG